MNVLVIGGGGREHALAWKIRQSSLVDDLFCAPGNPGTAALAQNLDLDPLQIPHVVAAARAHKISLVVIGPEGPLAAGLSDALRAEGIDVFGPSRAAARLESSKAFSKLFMREHRVPTADFEVFDNAAEARAYVRSAGRPFVIKADGLAAGKGVFVPDTIEETNDAIDELLVRQTLGVAGQRIVIEERLTGPEVSLIALTDGKDFVVLDTARDHKRAFDGDRGPNTGGMGVYSPAADIPPSLVERIKHEIIRPTIDGMAKAGTPFRGALYAGVMMDGNGNPMALEFNARFGDPETQPLMMRITNDLVPVLLGCARGQLGNARLAWTSRSACCVVMAAPGYPGVHEKGLRIDGLASGSGNPDVVVFHAGTQRSGDHIVTSGGRVLGVTALGDSLHEAADLAYKVVEQIKWTGVHYRKDIGRGRAT